MKTAGRLGTVLLVAATVSCQDNLRPASPEGELTQVTAAYVCGKDFDLTNLSLTELTVHFQVVGTPEEGELSLPAASDSTASTTRLIAQHAGALQVSYRGKEISAVANAAKSCPLPAGSEPGATTGEWTQPFSWPIVAVHLHLLPNGRVLSWGRFGAPYVWDPATGEFTAVPSSTIVFCSGHAFLPDGRLLVTGGHLDDERGLPDANIFDGTTQAWIRIPSMSYARWYPTSTTLADG